MSEYFGHDQWASFLQHSGTKGMRWGYNYGHPNGKRKAQGEEDEIESVSDAELFRDMIDMTEELANAYTQEDVEAMSWEEYEEALAKIMAPAQEMWDDYERRRLSQWPDLQSLPGQTSYETAQMRRAVVNPWYGYVYESTVNCAYCSLAYDLRKRGYDVRASLKDPFNTETTIDFLESWYKGDRKFTMNFMTQRANGSAYNNPGVEQWSAGRKTTQGSIDDVFSNLEKQFAAEEEKSHGIVLISWTLGGGHAIAWEKDKSGVTLVDSQINRSFNLSSYKEEYGYGISAMGYMKTNDLDVNMEKALPCLLVGSDERKEMGDYIRGSGAVK